MQLDRRTMRKLLGLIAFGVILNAVVHNIAGVDWAVRTLMGVLSPLLIGGALAFLLNIPMNMLERTLLKPRGKHARLLQQTLKRPLSILLSVIIMVVIVGSITFIILPRLISALTAIFAMMPQWVEAARIWVQHFEDEAPEIVGWVEALNIDWNGMQQAVLTFLRQGIGMAASRAVSVATSAFGTAVSAILSVVFALGLLAQKERLSKQIQVVIRTYLKPNIAERTIEICTITGHAFSGFVRGQLTEGCILGALCFVGMTAFRFPQIFLIAVIAGTMSIIPIIGAFLTAVTGALLIAAEAGIGRGLGFMLFFIILQQLEGNLIYPRVVGMRTGLPFIWVLVAITLGGGIAGVIGMILSIPVAAVVYSLVRASIKKRREERKNSKSADINKRRDSSDHEIDQSAPEGKGVE